MKPSTLLCALSLTQLGLAAPVPTSLSDLVAHVKGEARRLTKITRIPTHRRPSLVAILHQEGDDQETQLAFDNRPTSPSDDSNTPPSLVLAAPRPLKTSYLQSLARHPGKDRVVDVVGDGTPETIKPMTLEEGLAELLPSKTPMPCWRHIRLTRPSTSIFEQHPELVVLGAVLMLVLALLVLETIGTTFQGVRQHYHPRGEIRLVEDEKRGDVQSFRCDAGSADEELGCQDRKP